MMRIRSSDAQDCGMMDIPHAYLPTVSMKFQASFRDPHTGYSQELFLLGDQAGSTGCITLGQGGPVVAQIQRGPKDGMLNGRTVCH